MRRAAERVFDRLEALWSSDRTRRLLAQTLLGVFALGVVAVELSKHVPLPVALPIQLPETHFVAVELVVDLLLLFELIDLVFSLAASVAGSLGKQLQIFSLILVRKSFDELKSLPEPINLSELPVAWTFEPEIMPIWYMGADALAALGVFLALVAYQRLQLHHRIMTSEEDELRFIQAKKIVALGLIFVVLYLTVREVMFVVSEGRAFDPYPPIFTAFIFSDIALVLISLRYTNQFRVVFRNFGFAVVTVFMRLGITANPGERAALAVLVAGYAVVLAWAYNLAEQSGPSLEAGAGAVAGADGSAGGSANDAPTATDPSEEVGGLYR